VPSLSVVITTYNEEPNIAGAVESARLLSDDVLVIDSGSTDDTVETARRLGARILERPFDDMARQRNAALADGGLTGDWVMFLDADEAVTEPFATALKKLLDGDPSIDGVNICRKFHFWGVWVPAASAYPCYIARVVRRGTVTFRKEGHGEVFVGGSRFVDLDEPLHDEDHKPLGFWIERHNRYARMEAAADLATLAGEDEGATGMRRARAQMRRVPGWPLLALLYYLILRRGILEGRTGWTYCTMKAMYEYFVQLHMRDLRRRER
jgi:glycosyltransferase involved in cell wall biosynthesis